MRRGSPQMAIAELGRLQATLHELTLVPRKVAEIAAPKIDRLLRQQFRDGQDPYGKAWAPLKPATLAKGRTPPPLTDSTDLRDGTGASVAPGNRAGIRLRVGARYGYFHQAGYRNARTGGKVPARRILPQFGLPRAWSAILREAARKAFRQAVQR